jgi:hypothetical protein
VVAGNSREPNRHGAASGVRHVEGHVRVRTDADISKIIRLH